MKPILFSTPMVQAILAGRKTQTRRVMKPQPVCHFYEANSPDDPAHEECEWPVPGSKFKDEMMGMISDKTAFWKYCPYGNVGDILYVSETFTVLEPEHCMGGMDSRFVYKADACADSEEARLDYVEHGWPYQWKPSLFMPKEAARIFLQITDIQVGRLQDITDLEAEWEGIEYITSPNHMIRGWKDYQANKKEATNFYRPVLSFKSLWDSINAKKYPWNSDPWVWVVSFKKLETKP